MQENHRLLPELPNAAGSGERYVGAANGDAAQVDSSEFPN
jgi:hypothetical protein